MGVQPQLASTHSCARERLSRPLTITLSRNPGLSPTAMYLLPLRSTVTHTHIHIHSTDDVLSTQKHAHLLIYQTWTCVVSNMYLFPLRRTVLRTGASDHLLVSVTRSFCCFCCFPFSKFVCMPVHICAFVSKCHVFALMYIVYDLWKDLCLYLQMKMCTRLENAHIHARALASLNLSM